jgi:predicted phage replisome organizer
MAEVKWIKIVTDIFDDEKILLIESLPEHDAIIVIWFKLLCLAGKMNNSGVFMMNDKIPYTEEMLSTIFRRPLNTVKLALTTFEQFSMIERIDNVITIPNWSKHQTLDQLEARKEYMRDYMQGYREKQKKIATNKSCKVNSKVNSKANVNSLDIDIEEDIDIDKEIEKKTIPYQEVINLYNSICKSYPKIKTLSEARKKAIKARLNTYSVDDFKIVFIKAEESDFLKGKNNRNWSATFDWLLKDSNFCKVLEGNYDNKNPSNTTQQHSYNLDEIFKNSFKTSVKNNE